MKEPEPVDRTIIILGAMLCFMMLVIVGAMVFVVMTHG